MGDDSVTEQPPVTSQDDAVFGEPELKFGAGIVTLLLPWMVGPKAAKDIILTGDDTVNAERALALGIVSRVVPEGENLTSALRIAQKIAVIDPELVRDTKKALNRSYEIQGMRAALDTALDIDHAIESGEGRYVMGLGGPKTN